MVEGSARRRVAWLGFWLVATLVAGLLIQGRRGLAGPSTLSSRSDGWILARSYLEARGQDVQTIATPLDRRLHDTVRSGETWVLGFPFQRAALTFDPTVLRDHLQAGGSVLLAYSNGRHPGRAEARTLSEFGPGEPWELVTSSLRPTEWMKTRRAPEQLVPTFEGEALRVRSLRWFPNFPPGTEVLYHTASGEPVVGRWRVGAGTILVMPAELLSNGRLGTASGPSWLETLSTTLPEPWVFDEYHHGLVDPALAREQVREGVGLDALLLQIGLVYLAFVWAWGRRMGPAWRQRSTRAASADDFLLGLGEQHHRLGHHAAAAELLLERAALLDPRVEIDDSLRARAVAADARELVTLCNELEGSFV